MGILTPLDVVTMNKFKGTLFSLALFVVTWPYYRTLHQYTLNPIRAIAECRDELELARLVEHWRVGKENEMQFVRVAVSPIFSAGFSADSELCRVPYQLAPPWQSFPGPQLRNAPG